MILITLMLQIIFDKLKYHTKLLNYYKNIMAHPLNKRRTYFKYTFYKKENEKITVIKTETRHIGNLFNFTNYPNVEQWIKECSMRISYSTGLEDKNGKLIFEDDIVLHEEKKYIVSWSDDNAGFCLRSLESNHPDYDIYSLCDVDMEVLGNTLENPEFFKK